VGKAAMMGEAKSGAADSAGAHRGRGFGGERERERGQRRSCGWSGASEAGAGQEVGDGFQAVKKDSMGQEAEMPNWRENYRVPEFPRWNI